MTAEEKAQKLQDDLDVQYGMLKSARARAERLEKLKSAVEGLDPQVDPVTGKWIANWSALPEIADALRECKDGE